jgi:hypothetical protein
VPDDCVGVGDPGGCTVPDPNVCLTDNDCPKTHHCQLP